MDASLGPGCCSSWGASGDGEHSPEGPLWNIKHINTTETTLQIWVNQFTALVENETTISKGTQHNSEVEAQ